MTDFPYAAECRALLSEKAEKKGRPLRVFIRTFGCQQNEADSERLMGMALSLGYEKAPGAEDADLILYNTCAVREHAELRALSLTGSLGRLKADDPDRLVGLWGCMVNQEHRVSDVKMHYPYVDFVAGTGMIHRLPEILYDVLKSHRRRYYLDRDETIVEGVPVKRESTLKAWVSVMYGCNNFCTYCVVPYVRGRERSRSSADILREVEDLVRDGCKDITLLGQNVNSYNPPDGLSFAALLDRAASFGGEYTVRFMTSHPKDASDALIETMANNRNVAKHFHLPVQSGSDRILHAMNRRYTAEKYLAIVEKLRKSVPDVAITTDILLGFPGETEEDFRDTLALVKAVGYDSLYAFIYSPRVGTPAASLPDPTPASEKTERMTRLLALQRELVTKNNQRFIGKTFRVLCDSPDTETAGHFGRTSSARAVKFTAPEGAKLFGRFVNVKIEAAGEAVFTGKLTEND